MTMNYFPPETYLNDYGNHRVMVLESLTSVENARKHPFTLFFITFAITTASLFVAYHTFPESSSVLAIAFVAFAFMPIIHDLLVKSEEEEIDEDDMPFAFIATHFDVIHIYGWIFVGMILTYSFWSVVLPEENGQCSGFGCILPAKSEIFSEQNKVYGGITGKVTGGSECFNEGTKTFERCFTLIFNNNTWVMLLAIIFSFIWGAGALFLLGWNASVIGLFIGLEITSRSLGAGVARAVSYLPHGIPEIMAYFVAAIAGGIISAAISKKKFREHELRIVFIDTVLLLVLAVVTLLIGAFIETAEIFSYWEAALGGIIAFAALYLILYVPSIRYRVNRLRESGK